MAALSGTHREDGVAVSGYIVHVYNYQSGDIDNLTASAGNDTTDVNGDWEITGLAAEQFVIVISDPDDIKAGVAYLETAA